MFCKECGQKIDDDSKFCMHCGKSLIIHINPVIVPEQTKKIDLQPQKIDIKQQSNPFDIFSSRTPTNHNYDLTYINRLFPTYIGILIIGINLLVAFLLSLTTSDSSREDTNMAFHVVFLILSIAEGIWGGIWCNEIRKEKNRNAFPWVLLGIFFTPLSLIILGTLKKKLYPMLFQNYSTSDKSTFYNNYASKLINISKYDSASYYVKQAIEFNPNNHFAFDTRGLIKYNFSDYNGALADFDTSINLDSAFPEKLFHRGYAKLAINDYDGALVDWENAYKQNYIAALEPLKKFESKFNRPYSI